MHGRLAAFLIETGVLDPNGAERAAEYAAKNAVPITRASVDLKLAEREDLVRAFGGKFRGKYFNLDPRHFPAATRGLLEVDEVLELGALPLALKTESRILGGSRKILNVGLLDPGARGADTMLRQRLGARLKGHGIDDVQVFLVLGDQFVDVLARVYGLDAAQLRARGGGGKVHPRIEMFLP
jgi:hypothetical protein